MNSIYEPEWSNYLKQFDVGSSHFRHVPEMSEKCCVIIEPRKHPLLKLVCKNFMFLLKGWGLIVYHGKENEEFVRNELADIPNIRYVNINVSNLTIKDYNNLLCSSTFWKKISDMRCKHSLIFQTDTVLLKADIDKYLNYDYVGAPWIQEWIPGISVGNGGLSLRNVDKMYIITKQHPRTRTWCNEDIYFSEKCLELKFNIPSKETAKQFSVETIFYESPCGLHKPQIGNFPSRECYTNLLKHRFIIE
jgi:hypothetical protein